MSPRMEAMAFRIWQYANPRGWDCTVGEIAEALDMHPIPVGRVCAMRGWHVRLRKTRLDFYALGRWRRPEQLGTGLLISDEFFGGLACNV